MVAIDTTFLIDFYWQESPRHQIVVEMLRNWISSNTKIYVYYYCFNEFAHVISNPKRFETPYSIKEALQIADTWREMNNVQILFPNENSFGRTIAWMSLYGLGLNRLNDTSMASCYANEGITELITANGKDFEIFNVFKIVDYNKNQVQNS